VHLSAALRSWAVGCALAGGAPAFAQTAPPSLAASAPAQAPDLFDFWLGDWKLSWQNADGTTGTGRNRITKILDGTVIEENFEADSASNPPPLLKGRSLSVQQNGVWRQAWADNQGGFFALRGQVDGDRRIFMTDAVQRGGKTVVQRMVFHTIKADSLVWDWESSGDGGASWQRQWRIDYVRR
jgi:hypothetical protein